MPMNLAGKNGFVLPLTLILSGAILLIATLLLQQSQFEFEQMALEAAHFRTRKTLQQQVDPIVDYLDKLVSDPSVTTFLEKTSDSGNALYRTGIFQKNGSSRNVLGSTVMGSPSGKVNFNSPVSAISLQADRINLSPKTMFPLHVAWAVEDISLAAHRSGALPWWPLPEWQSGAVPQVNPVGHVFHELSGLELDEIDVIPKQEPIPFRPSMSPAFTPVVHSIGLRFGIFASGNVGQREKVIRIRYYLDCGLWNPYNRDLHFHGKSRPEPVFQLVFWNLPRLRINNISQGVTTGWIGMDALLNPQTGATGIHAWVRMSGKLSPGESMVISEPDAKLQPEGLARIIHPAFMVGPADQIQIQFESNENGVSVACLPIGASAPVKDAMDGHGWYRLEDFPVNPPDLEYARADETGHPFYLAAGSLSFRNENAQFMISANRRWEPYLFMSDPRRKSLNSKNGFTDGSGRTVMDKDLVDFEFVSLSDQQHAALQQIQLPALFSWPAGTPDSLLALTDVPRWINAFRTGSKEANLANRMLDHYWPLRLAIERTLINPSGETFSFVRTMHINSVSAESWHGFLNGSQSADQPVRFPLYPYPANESDFLEVPFTSLKGIAGRIASGIQQAPSHSISDFFNKGILADAFSMSSENPLHQLLPLRGLQDRGARMVTRGSAMILHLACMTLHDGVPVIKSARVWLMEIPADDRQMRMQKICFEWTDPSSHLVIAD